MNPFMNPSVSAVRLLPVLLCFGFAAGSFAQTAPAAAAPQRESPQDLVAKLNPGQKQAFDDALKAYRERRFADSLALHTQLLKDFPGDPVLEKFSAEDAIQSENPALAVTLLKPVADTDPDDWQAAGMLTRACAESGDKVCRDAGMAHILDLHAQGLTPPALNQYIVETVKVGANTLAVNTSVFPWGYYKVYALGRVTDAAGNLVLQITLESNDFDQPGFAKDHPDQAAKGVRRFSIDTYRDTGTDSSGHTLQTQSLYGFIDGQPSYDAIRDTFIKVASGQSAPMASRNNLHVP